MKAAPILGTEYSYVDRRSCYGYRSSSPPTRPRSTRQHCRRT